METQRWLNFLVLSDHELDEQHLHSVLMGLSLELGSYQARAIFGRLCLGLVTALVDPTDSWTRVPSCPTRRRRHGATLGSVRAPAGAEKQRNAASSEWSVRLLVNAWIASTYPEESKQRHRVHDFLQRLVFPHIGDIALADFTASDMRSVLDHIAVTQRKSATSRLCRIWMRAALKYAKTQRLVSTEELWEFMDIEPVRHKTRHKTPLAARQIRQLWADLDKLGSLKTTIGIRLLLLTFVRPVELMSAPWTEFDLEGRQNEYGPTWTIPSKRGRCPAGSCGLGVAVMLA